MKLVATNFGEVAKKPIDFFSMGHVIFGYVSFLIVYGMLTLLKFPDDCRAWSFLVAVVSGMFWEIIENVLLIKKLKKKRGKDSLENSLADQFFVFIGSTIVFIVSFFEGEVIYYFGFIFVILLTFGMYIAIKCMQKITEMNEQ